MQNYNPDVLSCLANLSNDEVFTPPEIANQMLDLLPDELWHDSSATFLDPACKSGVFLREIAKRLIEGLKDEIPDLQERVDHIFKHQLYGIAITELTSLLSRRSLYCSKFPDSKYSVSHFDNSEGNVRFRHLNHTWKDGKKCECVFCGASKREYDRGEGKESHAYEWIHTKQPEDIFNMKFDVIIGNPPYQMSDGGNGASAKPLYHLFVEQAKKLKPRYLTMIIPARWYAGGKGLDDFREEMLTDHHITQLVDYQNAKDCFPGVSLGGGVCYFLRERDRVDDCTITNVVNGNMITEKRKLDEFPVFVRHNSAINIIKKVLSYHDESISSVISSRNPFGLATNVRGTKENKTNSLELISSQGTSYVNTSDVPQGGEYINKYKVMISRVTSEHAGEPDKTGMYKVIAKMQQLNPGQICTDSYVIAYPSNSKTEVENFYHYLQTKFTRFLILQSLSSINLSREMYALVPQQDFSKPWTDEELYQKYGLTEEEIAFIESMIKPMETD